MKKIGIDTASIRKKWPLIFAIVVSIGISFWAFTNLRPDVYEKEAFSQSLVASREIKPFTEITASDLGTKRVLKNTLPKEALQNLDEIIGKVSNTVIKSGTPIYAKQLDSLEEHKNKEFISLPIDLPRSVGGTIHPGDIVDVYWIDSLQNQMWRKVGSDLLVVDILDSSGNTVKVVADSVGIETKTVAPTMVVLAVDKEYINSLIGGAAAENKQIVLVKKLVKDAVVTNPIPEGSATDETGQNNGSAGTNRY